MGVMRIPYTSPLPAPKIIPSSASTLSGAIEALYGFLVERPPGASSNGKTLVLTGAGISVASGLADYRGPKGTYTLNKTYRPVYYNEFCTSHEARRRYWARSFLGWTNLTKAKPNVTHEAVGRLGRLGLVASVITQNVDSFHNLSHPELPTIELHGYLRSAVCLTCRKEYDRRKFQAELARLNPTWSDFLNDMIASGALTTENPDERRLKGLKTNPDGDVDVPGVDYTLFKYPPCPSCLVDPPNMADGTRPIVEVDASGASTGQSTGGVLKPNVIMFGESIPSYVKQSAEDAIDQASRVLILGSSLATYSAWRLVKRARERKLPIGIVNISGVRGEEQFFDLPGQSESHSHGVRCAQSAEAVLPELAALIASRLASGTIRT